MLETLSLVWSEVESWFFTVLMGSPIRLLSLCITAAWQANRVLTHFFLNDISGLLAQIFALFYI